MNFSRSETLPPPPTIVGALKSGFDAVAAHATVVFLPVAFDLLLWLGPRLRMERLIQPLLDEFSLENISFPPEQITLVKSFYTHVFAHWNLLTLARTFPVGVSSLLTWMNTGETASWNPKALTLIPADLQTPLGEAWVMQVSSGLDLLIWFVVLTLAGWALGGVYYYSVSRSIRIGIEPSAYNLSQAVLQTLVLSLIWTLLLFLIGLPTLLALAIAGLFGQAMVNMLFVLMGVLLIWLLLPFFFSAHGVFVRGENALRSIWSGFQFVRFTAPMSISFALVSLVLSQGLNLLWSVPKQDSWMLAIGIGGHAFATTALLAGSFVYYRDMSAWLQAVFEQMKQRNNTV
ncbi:MAG: hypothetical protein ACUVRJ_01240 [Candidatus Villigracilaceae bacterium]